MKKNLLELIILYSIVTCVSFAIATLSRIIAITMGADSFTAFMVFLIVLLIITIIYLSIHVILKKLLLPWIGKMLSKLPYFKNKTIKKPTPNLIIEQKSIDKNQIRSEHLQVVLEKFSTALEIAHEYTQKTFAPYLSNTDINRLCSYITIYAEKKEFRGIVSIKLDSQLTTIDIYHFGWNIWNHFQISDQMHMARFLKTVFVYTLRDVEDIETIKKKLKIFESKCRIQIKENLSV